MVAPIVSNCRDEPLVDLLRAARDGALQVPDFQRALRLEDAWITSLLASVSLGHPIGAVTVLEAGNPDLRFGAALILGSTAPEAAPEQYLIDGQGRITALFQVLASGGPARGRWYFVDVAAALDPGIDRDDAIVSVREALGAPVAAARGLVPFGLSFDTGADLLAWRRGFVGQGTDADARAEMLRRFDDEVLAVIRGYTVPVITVPRERTRWSVRVHGGPDGPSLSDRYRVR